MTTTVPAIVRPFTLNARSADHRSSRIGSGSGTAPFGIATTTVSPSNAESSRPGRNEASDPVARRSSARLGRTLVPLETRHALDRGRRRHGHPGALDRRLPLITDRVPEQLVVIGEPVQRTLDPIGQRVGVPARDLHVRIRRCGSS